MERRFKSVVMLVVVAIGVAIGQGIWQSHRLFHQAKDEYASIYRKTMEHALLKLACLDGEEGKDVRYDVETNTICYNKEGDGVFLKRRVPDGVTMFRIIRGARYDICDTNRWTLAALDNEFQMRLEELGMRQVAVELSLKNRQGKEIDCYRSGEMEGKVPCRFVLDLGFSKRDYLEVACDFAWRDFWKEKRSSVGLLVLLFVLLVLCVVLLLRQFRRERRIAAFREMFAQAFTHDLKAPVGNIVNGVYLLEGRLPSDFKAANEGTLSMLRRQAERLRESVNKLLAALVREHGVSLHRERIDMCDFLRCVLDEQAWEKSIGKPFSIRLDLRARRTLVMGDKTFLEFAIQNVVENALKYSDPGVCVAVSACDVGKTLRISVEDNGWGIPAMSLRRIFKPGYRVPRFADKVRGSGVGLSVIRQIVKAHRGKVAIESRPGVGTKITITLPLILS